jgi:hypothetical protein
MFFPWIKEESQLLCCRAPLNEPSFLQRVLEKKGGTMSNSDQQDDYQKLLIQKRFLGEIEQGIRIANSEIIHKRIQSLDKDSVLALAVAVGRLRARYLEAAFKLAVDEHGNAPNQAEITELKTRREMFEEAKAAFEALRDAIEKGYVDIETLDGDQ